MAALLWTGRAWMAARPLVSAVAVQTRGQGPDVGVVEAEAYEVGQGRLAVGQDGRQGAGAPSDVRLVGLAEGHSFVVLLDAAGRQPLWKRGVADCEEGLAQDTALACTLRGSQWCGQWGSRTEGLADPGTVTGRRAAVGPGQGRP